MKIHRDTEILDFSLFKEYCPELQDENNVQPLVIDGIEGESRIKKILSYIVLALFWITALLILKLHIFEVLNWVFFAMLGIAWLGLYFSIRRRKNSNIRFFKRYKKLPASSHNIAAYFNIDYIEFKKIQFSNELEVDFDDESVTVHTYFESVQNVVMPFYTNLPKRISKKIYTESANDKTVNTDFSASPDRYIKIISRPAPAEKSERKSAFYLISGNSVTEVPLDQSEAVFSVGNHINADLVIDDISLLPIHLVLAKVNDDCIIMDRGRRDRVEIDGIKTRQVCKSIASRSVIKIGDHLLVYDSVNPGSETSSFHSRIIAGEFNKSVYGRISVSSSGQNASSVRSSILIGSHPVCDLHTAPNQPPLSGMVFWGRDGIYFESFGECRATVNRVEVADRMEVQDGDLIRIGDDWFKISFEGDVKPRAVDLSASVPQTPSLALTVLGGAEPLETYSLSPQSSFMIGRGSSAEISLNSDSVSRLHAKIFVKNKFLSIIDNDSFNKIRVNGEQVEKAIVFPGDIIQLGSCSLLLHYEIRNS